MYPRFACKWADFLKKYTFCTPFQESQAHSKCAAVDKDLIRKNPCPGFVIKNDNMMLQKEILLPEVITTCGVANGKNKSLVHGEMTMDYFFDN